MASEGQASVVDTKKRKLSSEQGGPQQPQLQAHYIKYDTEDVGPVTVADHLALRAHIREWAKKHKERVIKIDGPFGKNMVSFTANCGQCAQGCLVKYRFVFTDGSKDMVISQRYRCV